jgi:PAS domain S-box-containing protein
VFSDEQAPGLNNSRSRSQKAPSPTERHSAWLGYVVALLAVGIALLIRWLLDPLLGNSLQLLTFYGAVAIAVWFGGWRPAILAGVLGYIAADFLFVPPRHQIVLNPPTIAGMTGYAVCCAVIIFLGHRMQWTNVRLLQESTERKEIEVSLAAEKELLSTTLASIGDGVIVTDPEGRVISLNAAAERLTGWKSAEAEGKLFGSVFRIVNERTGAPAPDPVGKVLQSGTPAELANHTVLVAKDDRRIPIDDSASPIRQPNGELLGVVLVFRDVGPQRLAERERGHLAAIVEHSGDAVVSKNLNGIIQSWNASAERLFGYRPEEIIGKPVTVLIPVDRLEEEDQIISRLRRGLPAERIDTMRVTKDGRQIPVSVSVSPIKDQEGQVIGASKLVHDISERKKSERLLAEQARLLDLSYDAIVVRDATGRVSYWNKGAGEAYGYTSEEAVGRNIHELLRTEFPEPVECIRQKFYQNGRWTGELIHRRKDGAKIVVVSRWVLDRDGAGSAGSILETSNDITDRKRIEKELLHHREELERNVAERTAELDQSVRSLEELLYTIAHDLRAPNRAMQGYSHVLEAEYGSRLDETARGYLQRISAAALRNDALIRDLLEFGRLAHTDVPVMTVDARKVAEAAVRDVQVEARKLDATIEVAGESWPLVCANATLLEQVFCNLVDNALKYVSPGRPPRIELTGKVEDGLAMLQVKDNGPGIPPEKQANIFEPFTRLDDPMGSDGTGMGLAIVRKAAERMRGKAGVESNAGEGSSFWVQLPLASSHAQSQ